LRLVHGDQVAETTTVARSFGPAGIDTAGLAEALAAALARIGSPSVDTLVIGLASWLSLPGRLEPLRQLARAIGASRAVVAADLATAHLGALGEQAGTVVAVGTGVVAFASDLVDRHIRADGWGHLIGDEGGGAWIGRRGLAAAARAVDGRPGGSAALLDLALARFGPPPTWPAQFYTAANPAGVLASFAADVMASDDPVAQGIAAQAAERLADTACAAATRLGVGPIVFTGGVVAPGSNLAGQVARLIAARRPGARWMGPAGTPLDGALILAERLDAGQAPPFPVPYIADLLV